MNKLNVCVAALCFAIGTSSLSAQEKPQGQIDQVSTHMGEMTAVMGEGSPGLNDTLVFEPFQMVDELTTRDDIVFLMRHGPTDWSKLDVKNVAPTDCENQRIMSPQGRKDMEILGLLLGANFLFPSQIVVSEWCRNQQTLESLKVGFNQVVEGVGNEFEVETDPNLNLLLSLQGAPDTKAMGERISGWDGGESRRGVIKGPLLMISHFTNIQELTNFSVFEGEILVVDPKRENRVIGYLRLKSAAPDVGHFNPQ